MVESVNLIDSFVMSYAPLYAAVEKAIGGVKYQVTGIEIAGYSGEELHLLTRFKKAQ